MGDPELDWGVKVMVNLVTDLDSLIYMHIWFPISV